MQSAPLVSYGPDDDHEINRDSISVSATLNIIINRVQCNSKCCLGEIANQDYIWLKIQMNMQEEYLVKNGWIDQPV